MNSDDSDDELLANLLANTDDPSKPVKKHTPEKCKESQDSVKQSLDNSTPSQQSKVTALKELDFNFLDDDFSFNFDEEIPTIKAINTQKDSGSILDDPGNSSDDEDKKYFEKQEYSEYGREIKNLIKSKTAEKSNFEPKKENSFNYSLQNLSSTPKSTNIQSKSKSSSLSNSYNALAQKSIINNLQVSSSVSTVKKDVYSDPIFGLRMINPLISSTELTDRMRGRKAVTVSSIKLHLANKSDEDWVIAGVLLSKSETKTSQKGSQYCIWKISDLSTDMKAVSVFLFSHAYKSFWKTSAGTVLAILNPSVMESKDYDLATLSVDSSQKIMIMGTSKDLGKCKSSKKNGDPCSAPVNLSKCEYCIYHVKQEYGKFSKRSELQTTGARRAFGPPSTQKNTSMFQQRHPEAAPFIAIPAIRNEAQHKRDCELLASLKGGKSPITPRIIPRTKVGSATKVKVTSVELSSSQIKKDFDRLNKLKLSSTNNTLVSSPVSEENKRSFKLNLPSPKLGAGMKGGVIDFSEPISKNLVNKAKLSAIEYVKKNGLIKKTNPNKIRPSKDVLTEKGVKRRREEEESETIAEEIDNKKVAMKNKFQEMLEMKSAHSDLIEKHENEETEQYFKKLETKERMEEKMLTTFKVDCKAVRCSVCKYVSFSSSELCKKLQHPIKVIDAVKKFFKCGDCGNRTITLDRIPTETCKKCASSKWIKAAMMDEKRTALPGSNLCIRGGEEKFVGSMATDASLNLLVPETE